MADTNLTIRVDQALKDSFLETARRKNRNGSLLLRDFMQSYVAGNADDQADPPSPAKPAQAQLHER